MYKLIFFLFLLHLTLFASAQPGSFDSDFDADGLARFAITQNANDYGNTIASDNSGRIVVAGETGNSAHFDFFVTRLNPDGFPDNNFGTNGKTITPILENDVCYALALQSDGKIIAAGSSANSNDLLDLFALVRYNNDGSLDNTFSFDGKVITALGNGNNIARALVLQTDGKIIAAGGSQGDISSYDFALVRYNADGSLDNSFSIDGKVTTDFGGFDYIYSCALQPDGKILAGGIAYSSNFPDFAVARYNTDGTLDNTFSNDGKATFAIGPSYDRAYTVLVLPDGKILLAGDAYNTYNDADIALIRLNNDGSLDNTFGTGGKVIHNPTSNFENVHSALMQPDGKIVVAGDATAFTTHMFVARMNADGSMDDSFGTSGFLQGPVNYSGAFNAIALQSDYKIIATGYDNTGQDIDLLVARILSGYHIGIPELSDTASMLIYPNPAAENITIETKLIAGSVMRIYNAVGQLLHSEKLDQNPPLIDVSSLSNGIYIVEVTSNEGTRKQKLIIQR